MLPAIRYVVGNDFVFRQDCARAHRARDTIELLQRETPDFVSPELWPQQSGSEDHNVDNSGQRLVDVWSDVQQSAVDIVWELTQVYNLNTLFGCWNP